MSSLTFEQFTCDWLCHHASVAYKCSTYGEYESIIRRHLVPWFGRRQLKEIGPMDVQAYVSAKAGDPAVSVASVRNHVAVLRSLFDTAVAWQLVETNPATGTVTPRATRGEITVLSANQISSLIAAASPQWRTLIAVACLTGLRKGELLALTWDDVDLDKSTIRVRHTLYRGVLQPPKTRSSIRTVPVSGHLAALLRDHKTHWVDGSGFVFAVGPRQLDRILVYSLRRADLPKIRFHELRHSFVAAHIEAGTPLKVIQTLLGHASITTTMDVYGHLMPDLNVEWVAAVDGRILGEEGSDGSHQA